MPLAGEAGRAAVAAASSAEALWQAIGVDSWAVVPIASASRPGHALEGTRLTLVPPRAPPSPPAHLRPRPLPGVPATRCLGWAARGAARLELRQGHGPCRGCSPGKHTAEPLACLACRARHTPPYPCNRTPKDLPPMQIARRQVRTRSEHRPRGARAMT